MQAGQSTPLLLKHQHNLLCPHLKSSRVVGLQERSTDNRGLRYLWRLLSPHCLNLPEIFKHKMTFHSFISRKPRNDFNDSFSIQLNIISVFDLLIECTFSHYIHTYVKHNKSLLSTCRTIKGITMRGSHLGGYTPD